MPGHSANFFISFGERAYCACLGADGVVWNCFSCLLFFLLSPSLLETARYGIRRDGIGGENNLPCNCCLRQVFQYFSTCILVKCRPN